MINYPKPTLVIGQNMLDSFDIYSWKLRTFTDFNSTILPNAAVTLLSNLGLLNVLKNTPENMLHAFDKVVPKISAGLRHIVSSLHNSIGKLTDNINDDIKCLERSLKHLSKDFVENGVENLCVGKKTDFEPSIKCIHKLANTIASIAGTVLNDCSLSTYDVYESLTILTIILTHCFVIVQGTNTTIATIVHSNKKRIPPALKRCLSSMDTLIVGLTDSIRLLTDICVVNFRGLLANLVSLNLLLNETLEDVFGIVKGVTLTAEVITQHLSHGITKISSAFSDGLGCENFETHL